MENEKKKGKGIIIVVVILILIIIGLVGYICYDKELIFGNKNPETQEQKEKEEEENSSQEEEKPESKNEGEENSTVNNSNTTSNKTRSCTGNYIGEDPYNPQGGYQFGSKSYITLNADGTYTRSGIYLMDEYKGPYIIIDNTLILVEQKDIVGPREESTYYESYGYVIADDCSYIRTERRPNNYTLYRQ